MNIKKSWLVDYNDAKIIIVKTKIQIKSLNGILLFEYECEDNTIRKTLEKAVKEKVNLSYAYLRSADLRSADLSSANLSYADLSFANLSFINLSSANLSSANLSLANLRYADLRYADLRFINLSSADCSSADLSGANLSYAILSSADLRCANLSSADLSFIDLSSANLNSANLINAKSKKIANLPIYCKWIHSIIGDKIKIGCKTMTIEQWDLFFESSEEFKTKRGTDDFKQIQAVYLANKAYLTFLNN